MRTREVFLSRQVETLPATLIRGKCSVTLLSEVETAPSYLKREDAFFYSLVYDPQQKTLQADRGEIRIGLTYQAHVDPDVQDDEIDDRDPGVKDGAGKPNKYCFVNSSTGCYAKTTAEIHQFMYANLAILATR